ncbi:MAG: hypothetical protein II888_04395 [Clostridia bacterium]|nr:hypothetical protein [Clostridia bacterium]
MGEWARRVKSGKTLSALLWAALTLLSAWLLLDGQPREAPLIWAFRGILLFFFFRFTAFPPERILPRPTELALAFFIAAGAALGVLFDRNISLAVMTFSDVLEWLFCAGILTVPASRLLRLFCRILTRWALREKADASPEGRLPRKVPFLSGRPAACFFFSLALMLLCWLPVWMAYAPGLWNYDPWQVDQVLTGVYSKHHPLLHTLLLGNLYRFALEKGNPNLAPLLSSAVQAAVCSAVFALACTFIRQRTRSTLFFFLSLLFFALFPVHPILVISTTKDTLFAAAVLLAGLIFLLASDSPPGRKRLLIAAEIPALALVVLLRNNAKYCFFLLMAVCLFRLRERQWRRILAVLLAGTVLGMAADRGLGTLLRATPALAAEMFSIPSQMAARVQEKTEAPDPETEEFLDTYYSLGEFEYAPALADGTKKCLRLESRADLIGYARGSLRLFLRYPAVCTDAFLYTSKGLWDLQDTSHTLIYGVRNRQGYLPTDIKPGYQIRPDSLFPSLERLLEKLFTENAFLRVPVLRFLFAPALYVDLLLLSLCILLRGRGRKALLLPLFLLFLTGTIALGPGVLPRYVYPLMVCAPLLILLSAGLAGDLPGKGSGADPAEAPHKCP